MLAHWLKSLLAIDKLDECHLCMYSGLLSPSLPAMPEHCVLVCRKAEWLGPHWLPSEYLYLPVPLLSSLTHKERNNLLN